jgi:hypothetical protein
MPTRVQRIHYVATKKNNPNDWSLEFQWCQYVYEEGTSEYGYRFIWRREDGSLLPARGQSRLPSISVIEALIQAAKSQGWGDLGKDEGWELEDE